MSMFILPYFDFTAECPNCSFSCTVRVWNGVKNFEMIPDLHSYLASNLVVTIIKCKFDFSQTAMGSAVQSGPHGSDLVLLWAEDQKTYDLLCKLAENYHTLYNMEQDDGDEDEGHGHGHGPH